MKEEKKPRGVVVATIVTVAIAIISIAIGLSWLASRPTSGGTTQTQNPAPTVSAPGLKTASYKLIVGANPMIDQSQKFSPPTNSVVVTNEEQLQSLIEEAKKAHQKNSQ